MQQKVLIGTPAYGGLCHVSYTSSLIQTIKHCASLGIEVEPCFLANESLIPRARNTIVARFMNDPTLTHLLFIDADVNWSPAALPRLLAHNKEIIGAMYPKKGYDWQKLIKNKEIMRMLNTATANSRDLSDVEMGHIRTKLLSFVANLREKETKVQNGLVSMLHIGTGFMLIQRSVIQKMMDALPELKHDDDIGALSASENRYLYSLFDCEIHQIKDKKHYLSEDYLFCKRWTDMGGEIWADITISLTHTGSHAFAGNFAVAHNLTKPIESTPSPKEPKEPLKELKESPTVVKEPKEPPKETIVMEPKEPAPKLTIEKINAVPNSLPSPKVINHIDEAKVVAPLAALTPTEAIQHLQALKATPITAPPITAPRKRLSPSELKNIRIH